MRLSLYRLIGLVFVSTGIIAQAQESEGIMVNSPATTKKAFAAPERPSLELGKRIRAIQAEYSIVGLSAVAVKSGKVLWHTNLGLADIERSIPVTDETKFRIASISKTVAATALLQLWEKGKFQLDDDISPYLGYPVLNPRFPKTPLTFRQLLTHTSSLIDNANYERFRKLTYNAGDSGKRIPDLKEILSVGGAYYKNGASFSTNAPGTSYSYCNLAFAVVGTLVEKISGETFDVYTSKNILTPLGMKASFNVAQLQNLDDLAVLYNLENNERADNYRGTKPRDRVGPAYRPGQNALISEPQGGLRVSALDLTKFMAQFTGGSKRVLKKSTIELMLCEQWTNGQQGRDYLGRGLGFMRTKNLVPGELWIGHTGSANGLRSSMFFRPKDKAGVILITNGSKPGTAEDSPLPMHRDTAAAVAEFLKAAPVRNAVVTRR